AAAPEGGRDPLAALLRLREADDALERALQQVRDARAQRARAAASLEGTLLAARSEMASTTDYITTHRGAIGSSPRAQLAEAQQNLDRALALRETDPVAAAQHAAQAQQLAGSAFAGARAEVDTVQVANSRQQMGPRMGGGRGNLAGAIIGGILINTMLGGGRGFGGGGGRRGGGGGFGPASFGGGGTRMRRGGGGRF
ncbi:MAG TPA: TPM domain-containing protein, partial [Thermoleophilia bacterium]|nr:TPM domain-containing protein [Thermoleophilia bacterium]